MSLLRSSFCKDTKDPRREMNARLNGKSIRLRKQRKEERLQAKRLQSTFNTTHEQQQPFQYQVCLDSYLQAPSNVRHLELLHQALSVECSERAACLQNLIENEPLRAKHLIHNLIQTIASLNNAAVQLAFSILLELAGSCCSSSSKVNDSNYEDEEDNSYGYYGAAPISWTDLLTEDATFLQGLMALPAKFTTTCREQAFNLLGTVCQSSSKAVRVAVASWHTLVEALPLSSFCCASVLRYDAATFGDFFLRSLPTTKLNQLLQQDTQQQSTLVQHAAWMLYGLSIRDDDAVNTLCANSDLLSTVTQRLLSDSPLVAVPLCQALANLAVACHGRHVPTLLSTPQLVESITLLLSRQSTNTIVMDSIGLAGCLLCDAGVDGHLSTTVAVPAFVPWLVRIVVDGTFDYKSQAVVALYNCIRSPLPLLVTITKEPNECVALEGTLNGVVEHYLWHETVREKLLTSLASLIRLEDMGTALAALFLVDVILRHIPDSRELFEGLSGVDALDEVCMKHGRSEDLEKAQTIAADLLDDFFDKHEAEHVHMAAAPAVENNQFAFAIQQSPQVNNAFDFSGDLGRGRGMTMPAWMQSSF
jgi:hypothetical protein